MKTKSYELLWALLLILFFAGLYYFFVRRFDAIPTAQSIVGHSLGLLGSLMVLMTETLYSLRKRSQTARWGRMSNWLQFHIITGLVGPFLILLHSSWRYNGLAGVLILLMLVVVISGFFGRYIYTAIPRTADGVELAEWELEEELHKNENELSSWLDAHPEAAGLMGAAADIEYASTTVSNAVDLKDRRLWRQIKREAGADLSGPLQRVRKLLQARDKLQRQKMRLAFSRRVFSIWHSLHVPVGLALFAAAAVHMAAALYYATLLH